MKTLNVKLKTVKELKEFLEKLDDDTEIYIEPDSYYTSGIVDGIEVKLEDGVLKLEANEIG